MLDGSIDQLGSYKTKGKHSVSGLSSGAFMTVQLHVAHSADFVGAGVIAGGPYRSSESFRAALTGPTSRILNSLYVAMCPLTLATAPDVPTLVDMARATPDIDDLGNIADQRLYIFTGTEDAVVNQYAVSRTRDFYQALGVPAKNMLYIDDVPAGHSIITQNPEDSPLYANQPPYINCGNFVQSHQILKHLYPRLKGPADACAGKLVRFDQSEFLEGANGTASMAPYGYAYIPSAVLDGEEALGVHIALHGCKQGYAYVNFVNGMADTANQVPYGDRYVTSTGYMEIAEANNIIVVFPQVSGEDDNQFQNPDGCWDWWGYTSEDSEAPDFYTKNAPQIRAIHNMLSRLSGG